MVVRVANCSGKRGGQPAIAGHGRGIRWCPAGFSFAFKCLQDVLRQRGVEVVRHDELASGETARPHLCQRRRENGEQAGGFFGQALGAFGENVSMVNLNFNRQITHAVKLRRQAVCRKRQILFQRRRHDIYPSKTAVAAA